MIPRPPCFCAFSDSELPVKKLAGRRCDFCTKKFFYFLPDILPHAVVWMYGRARERRFRRRCPALFPNDFIDKGANRYETDSGTCIGPGADAVPGGLARQLRNIAVVWLLTGFWHGASWNFVLWGAYFGVLLAAEKLFLLRLLQKLPDALRHLYALALVTVSWTLFAFTDIGAGAAWRWAMFHGTLFDSGSLYLLLSYGPMLLLCALAATPLGTRCFCALRERLGARTLTAASCCSSRIPMAILLPSSRWRTMLRCICWTCAFSGATWRSMPKTTALRRRWRCMARRAFAAMPSRRKAEWKRHRAAGGSPAAFRARAGETAQKGAFAAGFFGGPGA